MTKIFLEIDIKIGKNLFRQGKRGFQGLANEKCLNLILNHFLSWRQEFYAKRLENRFRHDPMEQAMFGRADY